MADHGHHGEDQHDQRHVAMPSVPRAGFIVIEAKLVLRGLEAVLDCPAMSLDKDEGLDVCSRWTPGREEGEIAITDVAANQQATRPQTGSALVIFGCVEVGEFAIERWLG